MKSEAYLVFIIYSINWKK